MRGNVMWTPIDEILPDLRAGKMALLVDERDGSCG